MSVEDLWAAAIAGADITALLNSKVDANAVDKARSNRTALHQAAEFGHLSVVEALLSTPGIVVDPVDRGAKCTPLQRAADVGNACHMCPWRWI